MPPGILDDVNGPALGEPGIPLVKVVGFIGGNEGDVVGEFTPFGVVGIVETGGGGPTVVVDLTALEADDMPPLSENTISGAYGTLTMIAA